MTVAGKLDSIVMFGMKALQVLLSLVALPATMWASAPESIGGKVYRDMLANPTLRSAVEDTIIFGADGRFVYLKVAGVSFFMQPFASGAVLLGPPSGDGVYVYTKTGESTGSAELSYDAGGGGTIVLNFTSASGGASSAINSLNLDYNFSLSDLAIVQTAPATNLSTRAGVTSGQPLIVGFVVPGTRIPDTGFTPTMPDANQRDVLIRVVGPSLSQFGIAGAWVDPDFQLFRGSTLVNGPGIGVEFHYSDWSSIPSNGGGTVTDTLAIAGFRKIFNYVGAFPLLNGSKDAAAVVRLGPGAYTIVCNLAGSDPGGEALVEVYFLP